MEACAKVGFIYTGDDNDVVTVKVKKTVFKKMKVSRCKHTLSRSQNNM